MAPGVITCSNGFCNNVMVYATVLLSPWDLDTLMVLTVTVTTDL